jgi:hypothetical protein
MRFAPLLVLSVCLGLGGVSAGCAEETAPVHKILVDRWKLSGIAGVPVPGWEEPATRLRSEGTWFVTNMSYDELIDWYQGRMPVGKDFNQWDWCEGRKGNLLYSQGPKRILSVMVVEDNEQPKEESLAVLIGIDESGPC